MFRHFLHRDGVFVLRLVSKNAGDMIAAEMCVNLWDEYVADQQGVQSSGQTGLMIQDDTKQALRTCGINNLQ